MEGGVYDAVRVDLPIEAIRAMAGAREVSGTICGDPIAIGEAQRETLRDFVRQFDALARPDRLPAATLPEPSPRDLVLPGEADADWDEQT